MTPPFLRALIPALALLLCTLLSGGCAKTTDVVLVGTTYASLKVPGPGASGRGVLVVATPLGKGKGYAPVYTIVERDADSNPSSFKCLGTSFGTPLGLEVAPRPPWWRYVRGRWTLQTTSKTSIVAGGTTVLIIGYLKDNEAHEVVVLLADRNVPTSAIVLSEESGEASPLNCNGTDAKEMYVLIDGNGAVSSPASVDSWTDLRKAVDCIKAYIGTLGVETYFGTPSAVIP